MKRIKRAESLADQAFDILKSSILNGDLQSGETLPEEKYAKQLGISRTPFRDTLTRLANEGLIIQRAGAPAVVAEFTKEMSVETMELRNLLEVYNIEKIIHQIGDETLNRLSSNLSAQLEAIDQDDYVVFMALDKEFHLMLISLNPNGELRKLTERLNTDVSRAFLILSKTAAGSAREAYTEHAAIYDALKTDDTASAKDKMLVHLNNVESRFLRYYND